jgi:hypothetical protein
VTYLLFFLSALFVTNGVPHFVKGVTGERHMTPFGKPSSAPVNTVWGVANFYVAAWLWHLGTRHPTSFTICSLVVLAGVLLMGLISAFIWQHDDKAKGR